MSAWEWVAAAVAAVWLAGALFTAGLVWEREHLLENPTLRSWEWWGGYVLVALAWPWALVLWPSSRPVAEPASEDWVMGPGRVMQAPPRVTVEVLAPAGLRAVDRPSSLALCGQVPVGERVWVKSLGLVLARNEMYWFGDCGCRYNFSGFSVVLCRTHRSDLDPQGEPDDDAGSVGL